MKSSNKKTEYPFQGRNFFEEPESYFYSDCSSSGYLENYLKYRSEKIKELSKLKELDISKDNFFSDSCGTESILSNIRDDVMKGLTHDLDRFCVKFETRKKFYADYCNITLEPNSGGRDASFGAYVTFSECLCAAFEVTRNFKYLSTLLKVSDAICSLIIPFDFARRVQRLLELEMQYVKKL